MREEVAWWIEAGERDALMAEKLKEEGIWEGAAFHAQQSAEKALKALVVKKGLESRTHSCTWLAGAVLESVAAAEDDSTEIMECCQKLDQHYTASRYPNGAGGPPAQFYGPGIVEELLECRAKVVEFVEDNL